MEVQLNPETQAKLDRIAAERGRDAQALAEEAIERFIEHDEWFVREVEIGLAAADHGELIDHEEVGKLIDRRFPSSMRIRWTEPAVNDLTRICDYTQEHDGALAARRLAPRLYEKASIS